MRSSFGLVADYFRGEGPVAADDYFYGNSRRFYRWIERDEWMRRDYRC
jgi:hypothetical protein